tara:strand:- start:2328 stop:4715 length:2388 start_codon:yes stop_codon:yes gene_type:complete
MKSILIPQAFLQYRMISDLTSDKQSSSDMDKANAKVLNQNAKSLTNSSFGDKGFQKLVPMAKILGDYKASCAASAIKKPSKSSGSYNPENHFLNIENHKLSLLVPEIRLYRVSESGYKPFYFPVAADYNFTADGRIDLSKPFTSNSSVIKSFNVDFVGNNPFAAGLGMLQASLEIEVDSLSNLFDTPDSSYAQLVDLFLIRVPESKRMPNSNRTPVNGALQSGVSIQIAATLGYSLQDSGGIFTQEEISSIRNMKTLINLFYMTHNISLRQDGSASISVQYHGNLEAANSEFLFNAVEKPNIKKDLLDVRTSKKENSTTGTKKSPKSIQKDTPDKKSKSQDQKDDAKVNENPNHLSIVEEIGKIFSSLSIKGKNYPTVFDQSSEGYFSFKQKVERTKEQFSDPDKSTKKVERNLVTYDFSDAYIGSQNPFGIFTKDYIFYVTLGDFIDAYLKKMAKDFDEIKSRIKKQKDDKEITAEDEAQKLKDLQEKEKFLKQINVLFADFVFTAKGKNKELRMNIADIPISNDLIYTSLYNDFVQPRKYFFGLKEFLVTFCVSLVNQAVHQYSGADLLTKTKIKAISANGVNLKNKIKDGAVNVTQLDTSVASVTNLAPSARANYIIFVQERCETSPPSGSGKKAEDASNGILHLRTSQDRGLVKDITFSAMATPGRAEYAMQGPGNAFDALRIPQNATVTMFGNNLFLPSMEIYIDPSSLGFGDPRELDGAARVLGIGGYYTVQKISTSFSAGTLTTTLQCVFSSYPETRSEPKRPEGAVEGWKQAQKIHNSAKNLRPKKK